MLPFAAACPFAAAAAAVPAPPATIEAADMPDDLPAAADAAAAAALAAGGGRRAGAFILGHATPARLKEIMVHEACSNALRLVRTCPTRNGGRKTNRWGKSG